ncbi:VOC family protein [Streptomyces sp. NPDC002851]
MSTQESKSSTQKIRTCLWFDGQSEEAAAFYTSLFDDSRITDVQRYENAGPDGTSTVTVVDFELAGRQFIALDGGPEFKFNEAHSMYVDCADQAEVDELWAKLTADGGQEVQCGWLRDKYGLSWQIVPKQLNELLADPDKEKSRRVMKAMLDMVKLDVQGLRDAYDGK